MSKVKDLLSKYVGEDGFDTLSKAIYRKQTNTFADPLELYLPLLAVPRTILSWLVQNIKPMAVSDIKDFDLPGIEGAVIHVEKQASDVYKGEVVQDGKVIHTFENQSLPSIGGHIMTITESYDHIKDGKDAPPEGEDNFEPNYDAPKMIASHVLSRALDQKEMQQYSKVSSNDNVAESLKIISKLVDALVSKKIQTDAVEKELIEKEELEGDEHLPEKSRGSEEIGKEEAKKMKSDKQVKEAGMSFRELDKLKAKPSQEQEMPESEKIDSPDDEKPKKAKKSFSSVYRKEKIQKDESLSPKERKELKAFMAPDKEEKRKYNNFKESRRANVKPKYSYMEKPYEKQWKDKLENDKDVKKSTLQEAEKGGAQEAFHSAGAQMQTQKLLNAPNENRETARTINDMKVGSQLNVLNPKQQTRVTAPTKFPRIKASDLHSMMNILEQRKASRGVAKAGEMPSGAAMPKGPKPPMAPKPAVLPSKQPAAAQAQTKASAKGLPPAKPNVASSLSPSGPKAPSMKPPATPKAPTSPKAPAMKSEIIATVSKSELFSGKTKQQLGEFTESRDGSVTYKPNIEFMAADIENTGQKTWFVDIKKNEDDSYNMTFNPKVDQDSIRAFLLAMKARLLMQKKYKV
jgi:hypothetical protein